MTMTIRVIKCLFCEKATTVHRINVQKKINGKIVTLSDAPVYYCAGCNETFLSKEAQDALGFIRDRSLETKNLLFNYEDITRKMSKA